MNKAEVMRETERICRAIAKDFAEEKDGLKPLIIGNIWHGQPVIA